jgi:queuine tRNA-ribosyltransferase
MPTRDARHGRLYAFRDPSATVGTDGRWLSYLYIGDDKHIKDDTPLSRFSGGSAEPDYSLGYLHHLFKIGDTLFFRLATMHNLRFMAQLIERLREAPHG